MKRIFLSIAFVLLGSMALSAQNNNGNDVIYGKNGNAVRGTIVEQTPGVSYKIRTDEGNYLIFHAKDIERIESDTEIAYIPIENSFRPKSPAAALVGSLFVPGLGQIINGDINLGLGLFVGSTAGFVATIAGTVLCGNEENGEGLLLGGLILWGGCYFYSLFEAPSAAMRYNRENGFALGGGRRMRIEPDLAVTNTSLRGTDAACGMRMTISF